MSHDKIPQVGSVWRHTNGNTYEVILHANVGSERPKYPPTVIYRNTMNGLIYCRPWSDWHRSMTEISK